MKKHRKDIKSMDFCLAYSVFPSVINTLGDFIFLGILFEGDAVLGREAIILCP